MRSRAHYKAHPLHPALVPFPLAFLTGTLVFDVIGIMTGRVDFTVTASHLTAAGLFTGAVAAVPGVIDYLYTVPPESSAARRGGRHGVTNGAALALFAAAWLLRGTGPPPLMALTLEAGGAAALWYAASLGGTLVTRNMISVDHRYAEAGRWRESSFSSRPGEPLVVGNRGDLQDDQMKLLHVNGHRIVLARSGGTYFAFADRCTHRGGSLAGGVMVGGAVHCLWHGSQFEGNSGAVRCGPARKPIRTFELRQAEDGRLLLMSPPPGL